MGGRMPIADKAILMTGANRGIGQALVKDENGNIFHTHSVIVVSVPRA
jgi:short-subunit dehydrogenase